jgi:hypothetical protein
MVESLRPARVAGKAFRLHWQAGPTAGKVHQHIFHTNGTVSYAQVEPDLAPQYRTEKQYGALEVGQDVVIVSYLGSSGYTLTVAMDFRNHRLQGFASNSKEWYPVQGRFDEMSR